MSDRDDQLAKVRKEEGFIAALDQSGGSTPKALKLYGVDESTYANEEEMFDLVHAMRCRICESPAFTGERILGAILFEMTLDRDVAGKNSAAYLWQEKNVVPFLKVDKGLADEADGVHMMKPMPELDALLEKANGRGVFGTKMRSVIKSASASGIDAVVEQLSSERDNDFNLKMGKTKALYMPHDMAYPHVQVLDREALSDADAETLKGACPAGTLSSAELGSTECVALAQGVRGGSSTLLTRKLSSRTLGDALADDAVSILYLHTHEQAYELNETLHIPPARSVLLEPEQPSGTVTLRADEDAARRALDGLEGCGAPRVVTRPGPAQGAGRVQLALEAEDRFAAAERVAAACADAGLPLVELRHDVPTLERVFLERTRAVAPDPDSTEVPA